MKRHQAVLCWLAIVAGLLGVAVKRDWVVLPAQTAWRSYLLTCSWVPWAAWFLIRAIKPFRVGRWKPIYAVVAAWTIVELNEAYQVFASYRPPKNIWDRVYNWFGISFEWGDIWSIAVAGLVTAGLVHWAWRRDTRQELAASI